jgi:multiple sugar transport system ATP-binding protein
MDLLSIENLRKVFDVGGRKEVAVEGVDLQIRAGEFVSLLGPSGCGKTTTLRCVAGLEDPSSGAIVINGIDRTRATPQQRNIGMCFQEATVYPHMSIRKNLAYPLKLAGVPADERTRRVDEMARILKLEVLLDKLPSQLSGGQRQRAALGRALIRKPTLFLLDEPMSSLDAKLKVEMRKELKLITGLFGTTTLYVTHDQEEAMALSDRICVMSRGCIEQVDTPEAVYRRPATAFVAGFIGMPMMNFIEWQPGGQTHNPGFLPLAQMPRSSGKLTIGIRPEDVRISLQPAHGSVAMTVTLVEVLGERTILHLSGPYGEMRTTQYGISHVDMKQTVHVTLRPEAIHLFDAEGKRLPDAFPQAATA